MVDVLEGRGKAAAGNLPAQLTPFHGRTRELTEVIELLRRDDVRILTLTGPGGIGKTRLVIQTAAELSHVYPGGTWFVALAPLTDPELVLAEVAAVLDVQEVEEGSLATALAHRLSRQRTLVALDNLEQLLPKAASPIAVLSAAAPALDLIVSSREPLRVGAEREYPVGALSDGEAVALFQERARAARPDFEPRDDAERHAIAEICARLDRLPLAIELAAARTKILGPVKLLERLEQRLPLLTGGARDAPEHQRTLRATIAWSYDLLTEGERELFERLAIFSGGWVLEAAEAVCAAELDTLQSLIERSLVRHEEGLDGEARYLMLETIREFAFDRLEERGELDALRRSQIQHYLAIAEAADPQLKGPDQARWLGRLDAEHDNHRSVLRWALDGADPDMGLRLVAALSLVWSLRRPPSEASRWHSEALERTPSVATEARARVLTWAGAFARELGEEATDLFEAGMRCASEVKALAIQALATSAFAESLPIDRKKEMAPLALEAVRLARRAGDSWVLSLVLNGLGEVRRHTGEIDLAVEAYEESLALGRERGDDSLMALELSNLAEMAILAEDFPRAHALSAQALEHAETVGDRRHTQFAYATLGWVALAERSLKQARDWFDLALALSRELGSSQASIDVINGMAGAAAGGGDVVRAARLEALASRFEKMLGHLPTAADAGIHRRYLDDLRSAADRRVWEAAAREGAEMTLDEGIEYALSS